MVIKKKVVKDAKKPDVDIEQYTHDGKKRSYNPPVGLVTPQTDKDLPKKKYSYDPHLDPQLIWSGKKENTSFDVDTVSLHVHERIDPITIIENVMKKQKFQQETLFHYFELPENNLPNRQAIEFYRHDQNWSNRLIAGDSLLVANSLLQKESMGGKIQMIYMDPPYGITYGSNFQPFINKKSVTDGKDEDLTHEPEMLKAFRDTWELGVHSYLIYLRDRLTLAKELLDESGSCFVQISDENLHHVREIMDEVFGSANFVSQITVKRASVMFDKKYLNNACFYIVWYGKNIKQMKYHDLFLNRDVEAFAENSGSHLWVENEKICRKVTSEERKNIQTFLTKNPSLKIFGTLSINAQGTEKRDALVFNNQKYFPPDGTQWKTSYIGLDNLKEKNRLVVEGNTVRYKQYLEDYPVTPINSLWIGIGAASNKIYVVQTPTELVKRCMLMCTDPGDLVFDPTCGSGTTAFVAEQWGRRWITCDSSRVSITLTKQRLMTNIFDYYDLAYPNEGLKSGFIYKTVSHVTLGSIANNETSQDEILHDQPIINKHKTRISGPFTTEAVPSPLVKSTDEDEQIPNNTDMTFSQIGEAQRQTQWRDELLKTGIRGKSRQKIEFSRVEILSGTQWIHADAETIESEPKRVVVSFGPDYAPLEQRQVANAIEEAQSLVPTPKIVLFAAFQFDSEAAKDIDEMNWPGVTLLKVQMNADLFTKDLKKKRSSNESFWLVGQPDVELKKQKDGKYVIEVRGFDYYNTKSGEIESGDSSKIAIWELDTDYDGRSLYPKQIFFPMSGTKDGWSKLAKTLKAEIDEEKIEQYRGTVSLPFNLGINKKVAVKIIDDRGIESLRIMRVK